jgi:WD40 repeat protein
LESGKQVGNAWKDEGSEFEGVLALALSPDGKTVASGGTQGGTVRLWNIDTGKVVKRWTGDTDIVQSVGWSPDGCRVVSGSCGGAVRVLDVKSGETIFGSIETGQGNIVWAVSYSPDGKKIITGADGLQVWDANTGKLLKTLGITVACLAWASGGRLLFVGSLNKIKTFDTNTWTEIAVLDGHEKLVNAISLSPNERILASVSNDHTARLWNLNNNQLIGPPLRHECEVSCVFFSGKFLATGCYDHHMYTWDVSAIVKQAGLNDILSDNVSLDTFHHTAGLLIRPLGGTSHQVSSTALFDTTKLRLSQNVVNKSVLDVCDAFLGKFIALNMGTLGRCYATTSHANRRRPSSTPRVFR